MGARASGRRQVAGDDDSSPDSGAAADAAIAYGPLDMRLGYWLRRAQIAVFRDFFATFSAYDIRPAQYSLLTVIERNPGLKQGVVGEALGVKRANVVAMIDELEARKLVRRDPSPGDRRSYALMLTGKGARLTAELHAVSERHERRLIKAIGPDAYAGLFEPLRALARLGDGDA